MSNFSNLPKVGIVEYYEALGEYVRGLGYEDPRDKRIAELEAELHKVRHAGEVAGETCVSQRKRIEELEGLISSGFQKLSGGDVADALIDNANLCDRIKELEADKRDYAKCIAQLHNAETEVQELQSRIAELEALVADHCRVNDEQVDRLVRYMEIEQAAAELQAKADKYFELYTKNQEYLARVYDDVGPTDDTS